MSKFFKLIADLHTAADDHLKQQLPDNEHQLITAIKHVAEFLLILPRIESDQQGAAAEQKEGLDKLKFDGIAEFFLFYAINKLQNLMYVSDHSIYKALKAKHQDIQNIYNQLKQRYGDNPASDVPVDYHSIVHHLGKKFLTDRRAGYQTYVQCFFEHEKRKQGQPKQDQNPKTLIPSMQQLLDRHPAIASNIKYLFKQFSGERLQAALLKICKNSLPKLKQKRALYHVLRAHIASTQKVLATLAEIGSDYVTVTFPAKQQISLRCINRMIDGLDREINFVNTQLDIITSITPQNSNFELKIFFLCSLYLKGEAWLYYHEGDPFPNFRQWICQESTSTDGLIEFKVDDVVLRAGYSPNLNEQFNFLASRLTTLFNSETIFTHHSIQRKCIDTIKNHLNKGDKIGTLLRLNDDILSFVVEIIFSKSDCNIYDLEKIYNACIADMRKLEVAAALPPASASPKQDGGGAAAAADVPLEQTAQQVNPPDEKQIILAAPATAAQERLRRRAELLRQQDELARQLAEIEIQDNEVDAAKANSGAAAAVSPVSADFGRALQVVASAEGQSSNETKEGRQIMNADATAVVDMQSVNVRPQPSDVSTILRPI